MFNFLYGFLNLDTWMLLLMIVCIIASAILAIVALNPIHSLINLLITFSTSTFILFFLNLTFFALIFLAVYLGAIAVLFLFMIIMLDIKPTNEYQEVKTTWLFYEHFTLIVLLFIFEYKQQDLNFQPVLQDLYSLYKDHELFKEFFSTETELLEWYSSVKSSNSLLKFVGHYLLTQNILSLIYAALLLFIAMVGAIVLTLDSLRAKVILKQDANQQSLRVKQINRIK